MPRKLFIAIACICALFAYFSASWRHPLIVLPQESITGKGVFHADQIKIHASPFHRSLLYKGRLLHFDSNEGQHYTDIPCHVYLPLYGKRPSANFNYTITGRLCQKGDHAFVLKPNKKIPWQPLPCSVNLCEWRYQAKQFIARYLKQMLPDPSARTFLTALTIGEIDERILSLEFGKVGLQHILAISGFHFALAAFFLNVLLRLLFPFRVSACLLIAALSLYYLFLGDAPSIQRAYIAISLVAIGQLFNWRISGLNALGAGLIFELLFYPLVVTELSFQLTFLCTLAILLCYPAMHRALTFLLPKRSYFQLRNMSALDQHGYLLSAFFRKALALNLAVHFVSLPVLLFLFHKFPLLSIAYNLFFPACVCVSMLLLFISLFFAWLPPLSFVLHQINNAWTSAILSFTSNPPAYLDFSLRTQHVSFAFVLCFLALCFFISVIYSEKEQNSW